MIDHDTHKDPILSDAFRFNSFFVGKFDWVVVDNQINLPLMLMLMMGAASSRQNDASAEMYQFHGS